MKLTRFVVGVDSSHESTRASTEAIELAKLASAEVVLIHAAPERFAEMDSFAADMAYLRREDQQRAVAALEELSGKFVQRGARVSYTTKEGHPDDVLAAAVTEHRAELCVVGSHGYSGIERYLMGSVAERVVRTCPSSVLVSRRAVAKLGGYDRILVAMDFSFVADKALAMALEFANPGAVVDIVHCWQLPAIGAFYYTPMVVQERFVAPVRLAIREERDKLGAALLEKHRRVGVELRYETEEGPTEANLLRRLEPGDYDLIAMGSHGRRGVRRFIVGSVAEKLMRHAPCSALIAH